MNGKERRMYVTVVNDGKTLRFRERDDRKAGGSWLIYVSLMRDLLSGKRFEVYCVWVEDRRRVEVEAEVD